MKGYDYTSEGAYFLTICTQNREMLLDAEPVREMVHATWNDLEVRFSDVALDEFVIMPNHVHGIVWITHHNNRRGEPCVRPSPNVRPHLTAHQKGEHKVRPYGTRNGTVGRMVQAFKSITTHQYIQGVNEQGWPPFPERLWQRNYYERIIRNDIELNNTRQYILDNPKNWENDPENNPP